MQLEAGILTDSSAQYQKMKKLYQTCFETRAGLLPEGECQIHWSAVQTKLIFIITIGP